MQRVYQFHTNAAKRIVAFAIDALPITLAAVLICSEVFKINPLAAVDSIAPANIKAASMHADIIIFACSFSAWLIYCAILECSPMAATFGKNAMGLKVCNLKGYPPRTAQALARNLCKIVSLCPLKIGFVWALVTPQGRAWHDSITGTVVVER